MCIRDRHVAGLLESSSFVCLYRYVLHFRSSQGSEGESRRTFHSDIHPHEVQDTTGPVVYLSAGVGVSEHEGIKVLKREILKAEVFLQKERDEYRLRLREVQTENASIEQQLKEVTEQLLSSIKDMNARLSAKDDHLRAKDEQLMTKDVEISTRGEQLRAKDDQLSAKDAQLASKDQELGVMSEQLRSKEGELSDLLGQMKMKPDAGLDVECGELKARIKELEQQKAQLNQKLSSNAAELAKLEEDHKKREEATKQEITNQKEKILQLEHSLEVSRLQVEKKDQQIEFEREKSQLKDMQHKLEIENLKLKATSTSKNGEFLLELLSPF